VHREPREPRSCGERGSEGFSEGPGGAHRLRGSLIGLLYLGSPGALWRLDEEDQIVIAALDNEIDLVRLWRGGADAR
jgi:hypothetical protein